MVWTDAGPVTIDVVGWPEQRIGEILYAISELHPESYPTEFDFDIAGAFIRGYRRGNELLEHELLLGAALYRWEILWHKEVLTNYIIEPSPSRGRYGVVLVKRAQWLAEHAEELGRVMKAAYDG